MSSPVLANTRISVIGAGPGGLTCARILQQHGTAVTVYDRDPSPDARNQGGTLDLRTDEGQLALREAGLIDDFWKLARPEGQEMRQLDPAGEVKFHHIPDSDELFKPEIDRGQLRDLLLDSLKPETVCWGAALTSVSGPADGPRQLHFADGTVVDTDLVIGADGAFSRVRPAVSAAAPHYTGVSFLEACFNDVENRHANLAKLVGPGSAAAADGDRGLFAQRNSGDHIRVYVMQRVPLDWIDANGLSLDNTAGIRARLLDAFADWAPHMLQMITDNDGPYINRPILALPVPHTWEQSPTVTLLGDAAHCMPPVGVGVNLAMLDACELAVALVSSTTVDDAIHTYEKALHPRSEEWARTAENGAEDLISGDGPPEADEAGAPQR
jgi:2-polyprenyl-6-methoxyphenol hydroxylase-like FAD-dependent oxidoreductase